MDSKDFIALPDSGDSGFEDGELNNEDSKEVDAQLTKSEEKEDKPNSENLGCESTAQCEASLANELVDHNSDMEIEDINNLPPLKRARTTVEEQQVSVRITYNSLTRASKHKLEELLRQWSEWHAKHVSASQDPTQVLESGEETLFPALHVGTERTSGVSFWMDNQTGTAQNMETLPSDSNNAPLYDRGYALGLTMASSSTNQEGGLEIIDDASRCFNCGSYNHALRECPKPRDHVAVNNARKQLKIKKNQAPNSRNSTRYYQNSPAGKYDGLRPGALDAETRKLLGLGELDPPPWLNRMREIGYPPGYLDVDDEDQPSGIIIHGVEETKVEQEDGEIVDTDLPELPKPQRKMTVGFPGLNAPIPENADERRWAPSASFSDPSRNYSHSRANHYSEPVSRGHYREQRWTRDYRDDGPPGVDPGYAPSSYPPRYGSYEYNSRSASIASAPRSPTLGRSRSERGRRSSEFSFPYSPTRDSDKLDYLSHESKNDYDPDSSSHSWERVDRHRHHRRR
ncbi:uncharacterized protein LOC126798357 [Argentina anserina]|uniref:uncharacterized protein LOC126798357 n=1 Tax=Argentina anserina TaxID=57926 RepID=UPI0021765251|nr:uncharacterized protein LOC126798357 [Potentilla anserina]